MMGFILVECDEDSIEEVDEADASFMIIVAFGFSDCTSTVETNRRLARFTPQRCTSSIYICQSNALQTLFVELCHLFLGKLL